MNIGEVAASYHSKGFNCAQSVLCACGKYTGLDEKTALAVSGGFGGGLRCGEVCGAISGAVMAAGLCFPYSDSENLEAKETIAALARELTGAFREKYGAVRCEEIKVDTARCNEFIACMAELAGQVIQNRQKAPEA
jgi:C_GCAxxG_C_C family probable redox protein